MLLLLKDELMRRRVERGQQPRDLGGEVAVEGPQSSTRSRADLQAVQAVRAVHRTQAQRASGAGERGAGEAEGLRGAGEGPVGRAAYDGWVPLDAPRQARAASTVR